MEKTKIDWADSSWNPVTGCLHDCSYCYARQIAHRFGEHYDGKDLHEIYPETVGNPYPYEFSPTLHHERMQDPSKTKKSQIVFVCSMADLFGTWVPDQWIADVLAACAAAPQHQYLFLTKNPMRYQKLKEITPYYKTDNFWFGVTVTDRAMYKQALIAMAGVPNAFMSIEPMLDSIMGDFYQFLTRGCFGNKTKEHGHYLYTDIKWVIMGAMTGPGSAAKQPRREWIEQIASQCNRKDRVPVFMKESLRGLMGYQFVQEWPEQMKKDQ